MERIRPGIGFLKIEVLLLLTGSMAWEIFYISDPLFPHLEFPQNSEFTSYYARPFPAQHSMISVMIRFRCISKYVMFFILLSNKLLKRLNGKHIYIK